MKLNQGILENQLTFLNEKMREVSDSANQFASKFIFGGIVAVIALLNTDLVVLKVFNTQSSNQTYYIVTSTLLVVVIAYVYFRMVTKEYAGFRVSHRKVKYKFELTLYAILKHADTREYLEYLEADLRARHERFFFDPGSGFKEAAKYLLHHHSERLAEIGKDNSRLRISMLIVLMTVVVKVGAVLIAG